MEKLLNIAKLILSANPKALLSGSVALNVQRVKTMREPKDIDIFIPYGVDFIEIEGMKNCTNEDNDTYPDDGWDRLEYVIDGVKVDIFTPECEDIYDLIDNAIRKPIPMIHRLDIIKFKASHAYGDHYTRFKHRNDIIFMMINAK